MLNLHLPRAPSAPQAGPRPHSEESGDPARAWGFLPEFWAACHLAGKLCEVKNCYCNVTSAWPPLLRCLPSLWPPSWATSHPGYGVPRQEEATCCHYTPPQRRGCQALAHVRRPVLRHCGRVDWEVHSGLSQPCVSSLCRVAQVEVYLVRGLGPTHSLLGPLLSTIPEINYPCACGRFISLENSG